MVEVERVQTGVRLERRLLKVLKALAEYLDISLGDLLEGIVLHVFEQKVPFDDATIGIIDALKQVYGLDLTAANSHRLHETPDLRKGKTYGGTPLQTRPVGRKGRDSSSSRGSLHTLHPKR